MTCDSFLGCIAEPARHAILEALAQGPLHVGPLARRVGLEQSNVSHHLRLLRGCGFVTCTRDGKANLYSLSHPQVGTLLDAIRDTRDALAMRHAIRDTRDALAVRHPAPPPAAPPEAQATPARTSPPPATAPALPRARNIPRSREKSSPTAPTRHDAAPRPSRQAPAGQVEA